MSHFYKKILMGEKVKTTCNITFWDFPGGPVVRTLPSSAGGAGSIPGQGAKIPHALWPKNQKHKTAAIL